MKIKKLLKFLLPISICFCFCVSANAANSITSYGNFIFKKNGEDKIIINSDDLKTLEIETAKTETYNQKAKTELVQSLNSIGTYITSDGSFSHDVSNNDTSRLVDWDDINNAVKNSQTVDSNKTPTPNDISKDKVCWVNGHKIIGTGGYNEEVYRENYLDDFLQTASLSRSNCSEIVAHQHKDANNNTYTNEVIKSDTCPGGCYTSSQGHTHISSSEAHDGLTECPSHMETEIITETREDENGNEYTEEIEYIYKVWDCTCSNNTWVPGCGKTENTIDSVVIKYR